MFPDICPGCERNYHEPHANDCLWSYMHGGGVVECPETAEAMRRALGGVRLMEQPAPPPVIPTFARKTMRDLVWLEVCCVIAKLATCPKRMVGCVLVNARGHVLSTGYNGVASGLAHCAEEPCPGASVSARAHPLACEAIHAEANALMQCSDPNAIDTVYCTDSPCEQCVKLLLNTSASRIVFAREYPSPYSRTLWEKAGRHWLNTGDTA
jgi:dCMP deaminase